ncbi:MAG: hypothetical protein H7256_02960 [Bdellovibrio sp.]|nr:hypothetical protein [Bdellovibrio sp.]
MTAKMKTTNLSLSPLIVGCITFIHVSNVFAANMCTQLFPLPMDVKGGAFLHQKNPNLHTSNPVEQLVLLIKNTSKVTLTKPPEKVAAWINYLDQSYQKHHSHPEVIQKIKESYLNRYIIKIEDVPESFYDMNVRIAREQGRGNIVMTTQQRLELAQNAIKDQRNSLDDWLSYFLSDESASYPMWAKYWSFTGLVKLGNFNTETGSFTERSKQQMNTFAELNREAFAMVIDAIVKKVNGHAIKDIDDQKLLSLLEGTNFGKLYGRALQLLTTEKSQGGTVAGSWIKYDKGSDPAPLVASLKNMNTGWCTAGENTARQQLSNGDFYVYYSHDKEGVPRIPRIAIRMADQQIGEIRGTAKNQNLDLGIVNASVLNDKLAEFGDRGSAYLKKSADMTRLTEIDTKQSKGIALTKQDLVFLYEAENKIDGFGHHADPRIEEIKKKRNRKQDYIVSHDLKYTESEIALNGSEVLNGGIKFLVGNLYLTPDIDLSKFSLPEIVLGDVTILHKSTPTLILPKKISGNLDMRNVDDITDIQFSESVVGSLYLGSVTRADNVLLPQAVVIDVDMSSLVRASNLVMPKKVRSLNLYKLESAKGVTLPEEVDHAHFLRLATDDGLILPKIIHFNIQLPSALKDILNNHKAE